MFLRRIMKACPQKEKTKIVNSIKPNILSWLFEAGKEFVFPGYNSFLDFFLKVIKNKKLLDICSMELQNTLELFLRFVLRKVLIEEEASSARKKNKKIRKKKVRNLKKKKHDSSFTKDIVNSPNRSGNDVVEDVRQEKEVYVGTVDLPFDNYMLFSPRCEPLEETDFGNLSILEDRFTIGALEEESKELNNSDNILVGIEYKPQEDIYNDFLKDLKEDFSLNIN